LAHKIVAVTAATKDSTAPVTDVFNSVRSSVVGTPVVPACNAPVAVTASRPVRTIVVRGGTAQVEKCVGRHHGTTPDTNVSSNIASMPKAKREFRDRAKQLALDLKNAKVTKTVITNTTAKHADNCVLYLRDDLKIKLPSGLDSFEGKTKLINVAGSPQPGDIAIIRLTGQYAVNGHVAVVRNVTGTSITIEEANWNPNTILSRTVDARTLRAAESRLAIVGYYRPN
jgi:CHAP domain